MFDTLIRRVFELAGSEPDKTAVAFKKDSLTYRMLADKIRAAGVTLARMGITRGDRVLFTALSKPEMVTAYLGIQYIGAVAVFIDKNSSPESAAAIYEDAQAVLFITDKPMKEYGENLNLFSLKQLYASDAPQEGDCVYTMPDENETAELLFTTGTTGKPKGVILSYKADRKSVV